jgi:hypothetical protein
MCGDGDVDDDDDSTFYKGKFNFSGVHLRLSTK